MSLNKEFLSGISSAKFSCTSLEKVLGDNERSCFESICPSLERGRISFMISSYNSWNLRTLVDKDPCNFLGLNPWFCILYTFLEIIFWQDIANHFNRSIFLVYESRYVLVLVLFFNFTNWTNDFCIRPFIGCTLFRLLGYTMKYDKCEEAGKDPGIRR